MVVSKAQVRDTPKETTIKMVALGCCFGIVNMYDLISENSPLFKNGQRRNMGGAYMTWLNKLNELEAKVPCAKVSVFTNKY